MRFTLLALFVVAIVAAPSTAWSQASDPVPANTWKTSDADAATETIRTIGSRPYPHPHRICVRCPEAVDVTADRLEDLSGEVGELHDIKEGYHIFGHRVDVLGVCPRCRKRERVQADLPSASDARGSASAAERE